MKNHRRYYPRHSRLSGCLLVGLLAPAIAFSGQPVPSTPSPALVSLGHTLFFDKRLSQDTSVSCSSCHQPEHGFADGRNVSVGVARRVGTRNTPSLLNVFDDTPLFWDGRRNQLQVAVLDPLTNPVEMAQPNLESVIRRLETSANYKGSFASAFPGEKDITSEELGLALAAFIRTLPQTASAYDRYASGRSDALSYAATDGLRLFEGKGGCSGCHRIEGARFTDGDFHHSGVGIDAVGARLGKLSTDALHRNLQGSALGDAVAQDATLATLGRFLVSHRATDVGAFRTPSLRNVAVTAPYMHDGSVKTLEEAVDTEVYYRGLATGKPIALTIQERADLIAFLRSLTTQPAR